MMMGLGFLVMLAVLAVPIVLLAGLVLLMIRPIIRKPDAQPATGALQSVPDSNRSTCSHCGAQLRPEWAHCPQCGAPAGNRS